MPEDEDGVACAWVAHLGDQVGRDDAGPARSAERAASAERDVLLAVDGVVMIDEQFAPP